MVSAALFPQPLITVKQIFLHMEISDSKVGLFGCADLRSPIRFAISPKLSQKHRYIGYFYAIYRDTKLLCGA